MESKMFQTINYRGVRITHKVVIRTVFSSKRLKFPFSRELIVVLVFKM